MELVIFGYISKSANRLETALRAPTQLIASFPWILGDAQSIVIHSRSIDSARGTMGHIQ